MPSQRLLPALFLLFSTVACQGVQAGSYSAPARSNKASTQLIEAASRQYEEGKLDQAAATLERALQIQPGNPATLHYLGVLRLEQGNTTRPKCWRCVPTSGSAAIPPCAIATTS